MEAYTIYIEGIEESKMILEEELRDADEVDVPYIERAINALSQLEPKMIVTTLEEYFDIHDSAYYVTEGYYQTFDGGKRIFLSLE